MDPISEIKSRISIEDLVSKYVQLKKAGRHFKALCPFHQEKTPSFYVSPEKQLAYCFGCHRGGDIFKFIREVERIDFVEALKLLADRAGVELPKKFVTGKKGKRDRLKSIHQDAAEYYQKQLWETKKGESVLSYLLKKRKFSKETVKKFGLGVSPDEGNELISQFLKQGYSSEEILESGVGVSRQVGSGEIRDRFHGRLIIPIFDIYGDIVAFGGRALREDQQPKYLNSPETPLYEKGNMFYAMHAAKENIKKHDKAVLVEGYMDVIRAHEAGIEHAIGTCGTAFTGNQVRLLKRFTNTVVFFFDGDEAGKEATFRAFEPAISEGMSIQVLRPPKGKDPDDWIRDDPKEVKEALTDPPFFFDFLLQEIAETHNLTRPDEQKKALAKVFPFFSKVKSGIEQDQYLQKLAKIFQVQPKVLYSEFSRFKGAPEYVRETFETKISAFTTGEYLLGCFLQYPETWETLKKELFETDFDGEQNRLYKIIESIYNTDRPSGDDIFISISEEFQEKARVLALFSEAQNGDLPYEDILEEVKRATKKFLQEKREEQKRRLLLKIKEAEGERDQRSLQRLLVEYQALLIK